MPRLNPILKKCSCPSSIKKLTDHNGGFTANNENKKILIKVNTSALSLIANKDTEASHPNILNC